MKRKMIMAATASFVMLSVCTVTVFAADGGCSYLEGQKRCESRLAVYSEAEKFTADSERDEFLQSHGIGDTEYSEESAALYSYIGGQTDSYHYEAGQKRGGSQHRDLKAEAAKASGLCQILRSAYSFHG